MTPDTSSMNLSGIYFRRLHEVQRAQIRGNIIIIIIIINIIIIGRLTSKIQRNLFFGTPPFRGHKIWFRKNIDIIFVSVISIEGTPLFKGKRHFFYVLKPWFNFHSGDTLALKRCLTT